LILAEGRRSALAREQGVCQATTLSQQDRNRGQARFYRISRMVSGDAEQAHHEGADRSGTRTRQTKRQNNRRIAQTNAIEILEKQNDSSDLVRWQRFPTLASFA
jgi:hypothetical protein